LFHVTSRDIRVHVVYLMPRPEDQFPGMYSAKSFELRTALERRGTACPLLQDLTNYNPNSENFVIVEKRCLSDAKYLEGFYGVSLRKICDWARDAFTTNTCNKVLSHDQSGLG
jgi:hypothetical protein